MKIIRINPGLTHCHNYAEILGIRPREYLSNFDELNCIYSNEEVFTPGSWVSSMNKIGVDAIDLVYWDIELLKSAIIKHSPNISKLKKKLIISSYDRISLFSYLIELYEPDYVLLYAGGLLCITYKERLEIELLCTNKINWIGFWADELPVEYDYNDFFNGISKLFTSTQSYSNLISNQYFIESTPIGNCVSMNFYKFKNKKLIDRTFDLVFVGSTGYGMIEHVKRYEFLKRLCESKINILIISNEPDYNSLNIKNIKLKIKFLVFISSYVPKLFINIVAKFKFLLPRKINTFINLLLEIEQTGKHPSMFFPSLNSTLSDIYKDKLPLYIQFPKKVKREAIFGKKYQEYLSESKCVFNIHRDEIHDYGNVRTFEVTGSGALLMSDKHELMSEYFIDNVDYISFDSVSSFIKKYNFIMANPELMQNIADSGYHKTLKNYTSDHQTLKIFNALN